MNEMWNILEIEPTTDVSAIKRAYAQQAKRCHPEEDPEGFMLLRQAYQAALSYAEQGGETPAPEPAWGEDAIQGSPDKTGAEPEGETGWFLAEEGPEAGANPYEDHDANRQFLELYTGKRRKDAKAWMGYFTSPAFLDAAYDGRFTALLLENVTRLEGEFPPTKEFLSWLSIAYQYTLDKWMAPGPDGVQRQQVQFRLYEGAGFDGIDPIFQIAVKGPAPRKPRGNEQAVLTSFLEYRYLLRLAEQGDWGEQAVESFTYIMGRYVTAYLKDNCTQRGSPDTERHPAGLQLIIHFFRGRTLPEDLYRIVWQKFDLKSAIMGRSGTLYGPLRKLVIERVPGIDGEAAESFLDLNGAYTELREVFWKHDPELEQAALDAFFARDDLRRALKSHRFVENNMLSTWTADWAQEALLKRFLVIYQDNPDLPRAGQIAGRIRQSLAVQKIKQRTEADRTAPVPEGRLELKNSPFFRHWLNTGFYLARDPETSTPLLEYLAQNLPWLEEWSRRFLDVEDGEIPVPRCVSCTIDGSTIEIRFHLRYIDFLLDGKPVSRPCLLPWERLAGVGDTEAFFFLLPVTASTYDRYEMVREELFRRLSDTAAPEEDRGIIAGCLAGHVCRLPVPENGGYLDLAILPMEWFAEDAGHLYGCSWYEREQVLLFFTQSSQGRLSPKDGVYEQIGDAEAAYRLAQRLLTEAASPSSIHVDLLTNLPEDVYVDPDYMALAPAGADIPRELHVEDVTLKKLDMLFALLADGKLARLELSWPAVLSMGRERRSLVFLKERDGWACLYFDDASAQSYALLASPEQYWNMDDGTGKLTPFRQGKLFDYSIHRGFATIRPHLDNIFRAVNQPNSIQLHTDHIWTYAVNITHGRHKYILDKRLLGGFPMERAHNQAADLFYLSMYPDLALWLDEQGDIETVEIGKMNRDRVQYALARMMRSGLTTLRLTWGVEPGQQRHVVVLREQGWFMLAYLVDNGRKAEFHVADVRTYLDVEGKKYPKAVFRGRTVPAYLLHDGVTPLRCALEDLLANMEDPAPITGKFAEYAAESPVKPRPYETIRAELLDSGSRRKEYTTSDAILKEIKKLIQEKEIPVYPRLTKTDIETFNRLYGVELPAEYALFLKTIGDGWENVRNQHFSSVRMNRLNESLRRPEWLNKDFPFSEAWLWEDHDDEAVFPRKPDESDKEYSERMNALRDAAAYGHLTLIDLGDGLGWDLILNGPSKGQIWFFCGEGMSPCKPKLTFLEFIKMWLDGKQEISDFAP